jgi:hypothetical protein
MNNQVHELIIAGFMLYMTWIGIKVGMQIYKDRMRARLRRQIARMRRDRMLLLLKRREARNAARLARELGV